MHYVLAAILGYFVGNIASSYFAGRLLKNIDIRQHGSGNAGATNAFRVLGFKAGLAVFLCDVLKGVLAVLLGSWVTGGAFLGAVLGGCFAVAGHNWPVVLGFKGGKGIATSLGMVIAVFPIISVILFFLALLVILLTRYVSLASISAALLLPILLLLFQAPPVAFFFGLALSALAIFQHRKNIVRLVRGSENRITLRPKGSNSNS
jgi:glycerol-3-phosphate acyltransferase PlsY